MKTPNRIKKATSFRQLQSASSTSAFSASSGNEWRRTRQISSSPPDWSVQDNNTSPSELVESIESMRRFRASTYKPKSTPITFGGEFIQRYLLGIAFYKRRNQHLLPIIMISFINQPIWQTNTQSTNRLLNLFGGPPQRNLLLLEESPLF